MITNFPLETKIAFTVKENPKMVGSKARRRFGRYMGSKTVEQFLQKGGRRDDLIWDINHGYVVVK